MYTFSVQANRTIKRLEEAGLDKDNLQADLRLLLYGAKPAVLLPLGNLDVRCFVLEYPSLTVPRPIGKSGVLIFQSADILVDYIRNTAMTVPSPRLGQNILDCTKENLGLLLGYPPVACRWFEDSMQLCLRKVNEKKCKINYHGYRFVADENMVEECVNWMKVNRPIPKEIQTGVTVSYASEMDENGKVKSRKQVPYPTFLKM
ncbi:hypothetical protein [Bacillus cereus]|uniref:hypothetical protein n=1 Tax=Bacillus cereus TaxID=1396 RepID=UPI000BFBCC81|nr:hypothetical protein [Bacillus cereus]PGR83451.1 hypothetical protein COC63_05565 [Bacillus cereus]